MATNTVPSLFPRPTASWGPVWCIKLLAQNPRASLSGVSGTSWGPNRTDWFPFPVLRPVPPEEPLLRRLQASTWEALPDPSFSFLTSTCSRPSHLNAQPPVPFSTAKMLSCLALPPPRCPTAPAGLPVPITGQLQVPLPKCPSDVPPTLSGIPQRLLVSQSELQRLPWPASLCASPRLPVSRCASLPACLLHLQQVLGIPVGPCTPAAFATCHSSSPPRSFERWHLFLRDGSPF